MKKSFGIIFVIAVAAIFAFIVYTATSEHQLCIERGGTPIDGRCGDLMKNEPSVLFPNVPEIVSYDGINCNVDGSADVNCFVGSFNECNNAIIKNIANTIEGDPIITVAMIHDKESNCDIVVYEDTTLDRFGKPGIAKYTCSTLTLDEKYLNISPCENELNQAGYGFVIPNTPIPEPDYASDIPPTFKELDDEQIKSFEKIVTMNPELSELLGARYEFTGISYRLDPILTMFQMNFLTEDGQVLSVVFEDGNIAEYDIYEKPDKWEQINYSNSLRPEDRLKVSHTAGYTTVFITLSSWDEYNDWESKRGPEHDLMPPLEITEDNINPIVYDLLLEMWKFENYEISKFDNHLFEKRIQKDYSVSNHHGIHDWMESEYAKQFGPSDDGFSHYFEFQDNVYTVIMLAAD